MDVRGTPGYMPPEMMVLERLDGDSVFDLKKVDSFSLGVMLFQLATGICPFVRAVTTDKHYKYFMKGNLDKFWRKHKATVEDEDLRSLIEALLTAEAKERITVSRVLRHPWMCQDVDSSSAQAEIETLLC